MKKILNEYLGTVRELLKEEDKKESFSLLTTGEIICSIEENEDSYDYTDYYTILIYITPNQFGKLKSKIETIENEIKEAFDDASKGENEVCFRIINIIPKKSKELNRNPIFVEEEVEQTFWTLGYYRIFISHSTVWSQSAINLKKALIEYGISSFVAHEDIKPTKKWLEEIRKALRTMNCLCAIFTPDIKKSEWCNQEIGHALGRNVFVISINRECTPYGFLAEEQALNAFEKNSKELANEIFTTLCSSPLTKNKYNENLVKLFLSSKSEDEAYKWMSLLKKIPHLDFELVNMIYLKYGENENLQGQKILSIANDLFKKYRLNIKLPEKKKNDILNVDDLPF